MVLPHPPEQLDDEDEVSTGRVNKASAEALKIEAIADTDGALVQGSQVGRYSVLSRLGAGGMGIVYKAWDPQLDRPVALKVLRRDRVQAGESVTELHEALLREAQTLAKLSHPNIVTVYDAGLTGNGVFVAMELSEGMTLHHWTQRDKRTPQEILDVFIAAGRGLAAAHAAGVVHRDFKPANVLIAEDGAVRVADFGLAHLMELKGPESTIRDTDSMSVEDFDDHATYSGDYSVSTIVGTPKYMAPEQLMGRAGDHRLDQFAFCLTLYTALIGHAPFPGDTFYERRDIVPLGLDEEARERLQRARGIPARVRRALLKGLATDARDRFDSMDLLLHELVERRRWPWVLASSALALGFGGGAVLAIAAMNGEGPCDTPHAALEGTWGRADRTNVEQAFVNTRHPDAPQMLARTLAELDEYSDEWVSAYATTCQDTYVTRQQSEGLFDARMRCLKGRRNRLRAAIDTLTEASEAREVQDRMVASFRLPLIAECSDVELVEARFELPSDPSLRTQLEDLDRLVDISETLRDAGDYVGAVDLATTAISSSRALNYPPLLARALGALGHAQVEGASAMDAEATLREAIMVAAHASEPSIEARAWTLLLFSTVPQGRSGEGLLLSLAAESAVDRAKDQTARSWLLNSLGVLHGEQGNFDDARNFLQRALELKTEQLGENHVEVGIAWFNLANLLVEEGQPEAREALLRAYDVFGATVGPEHPFAQYAVSGLCRLNSADKRFARAHEQCAQVLRHFENWPSSPMWMSRVHFDDAKALHGLGMRTEARTQAERARKLVEVEHPDRARTIQKWVESHLDEPSPSTTSSPE